MVEEPWPIWSSSALRLLALCVKLCDVKNALGLSAAELTFLPVASAVCVVVRSFEVCWRASRFERMPAVKVTSLIVVPFWLQAVLARARGLLSVGASALSDQADRRPKICPKSFKDA
jgi:hypothetical protein